MTQRGQTYEANCQAQVQSPKVKTKRTWADTKITWANHHHGSDMGQVEKEASSGKEILDTASAVRESRGRLGNGSTHYGFDPLAGQDKTEGHPS